MQPGQTHGKASEALPPRGRGPTPVTACPVPSPPAHLAQDDQRHLLRSRVSSHLHLGRRPLPPGFLECAVMTLGTRSPGLGASCHCRYLRAPLLSNHHASHAHPSVTETPQTLLCLSRKPLLRGREAKVTMPVQVVGTLPCPGGGDSALSAVLLEGASPGATDLSFGDDTGTIHSCCTS